MKLKIEQIQYQTGDWYYEVYEKKFIFFWIRRDGFFGSLKHAEDYAMKLLKERKRDLKKDKEAPVYYQLDGDKITRKVGINGDQRVVMEDPQKEPLPPPKCP